jgi:restriction endonuclease
MNSIQYEELCRFFIAKKLSISIDLVKSIHIPNPVRLGLPEYKHQIDLYWETEDEIAKYLNIANAKWRRQEKVDQPDVLLLQQVKQKVGAHKAIMITNVGFTSGAEAAAQDDGIGLHIVVPAFDYSRLPKEDRKEIQQRLNQMPSQLASVIYSHTAHKAIEIELIAVDNLIEGADPVDQFKLCVLEQRLGYLWMLSANGDIVDPKQISDLETEIDQMRARLKRKL